jgi:ubiquinone biosynthesis protein
VYLGWLLARNNALEVLKVLHVPTVLYWPLKLLEKKNSNLGLGERMANAAISAGPIFVKFGQALSTRTDLLGPEIADEIAHLRDRLPPFASDKARTTIEKELGSSIEQLFSSFEDVPIAAASIAQVHFAITSAGEKVAVKVLRPNIEKAFSRDLELLRWLARMAIRVRPAWKRLRLADGVEVFADMVRTEMDLRLEGAAASELRENFENDASYNVPKIFWQYTSKRVLTTSRVSGVPIDKITCSENHNYAPDQVLEHASRAMFHQVFRDGFFHGDPHPGNLMVAKDGTIHAVDFGIMGRLDFQSRLYIAETLLCIFTREYERAARLHLEAGYVPKGTPIGAFSLALRSIAEPMLDLPPSEVSVGRLLGHLFHVTETFGMETQPHLLLLQKVVVIAEGTARTINPSLNIWEIVQPLVEDWVKLRSSPEQQVRDATIALRRLIIHGPHLLAKFEAAVSGSSNRIEPRLHPKLEPNQCLTSFFWLTTVSVWVLVLITLLG